MERTVDFKGNNEFKQGNIREFHKNTETKKEKSNIMGRKNYIVEMFGEIIDLGHKKCKNFVNLKNHEDNFSKTIVKPHLKIDFSA